MNFFNKIVALQNQYAFNSEINGLDYDFINEAEYQAESKMRDFASDNQIDGSDLMVWEDGVKSNNDLLEADIVILEQVYLSEYEISLSNSLNKES